MAINRMSTEHVPVVRQHRPISVRNATSMVPGRAVPIFAAGLLRGDSCSGRLSVGMTMAETYEVIFNQMSLRVTAWFVPKVALDRFQRNRTFFERSAAGLPQTDEDGAAVIDYIQTMEWPATVPPILRALGKHEKPGADVSDEYVEAYNQIIRLMYRMRSKSLPERDLDDTSYAAALWGSSVFSEVVPNFDAGMIAGELPLTIVSADLPVTGIGVVSTGSYASGPVTVRESGTGAVGQVYGNAQGSSSSSVYIERNPGGDYPNIYAELAGNSTSVALANIDQARSMVQWAKYRERYEGHRDPWVIDQLMSGLSVDDQAWFMPMLLDMKTVTVDQMKRMATDGASLEDGVANGVSITSVGVNVPQNTFGGTIMLIAECVPEQLFERQADPYMSTIDPQELPNYMRDVLNPMPVVPVKNREVDVLHTVPDGRFGYARRNWKWAKNPTNIGGVLYSGSTEPADEAERRILYPTDVSDPGLTEEFYLATTLGREVFLNETVDPMKVAVRGTLDVMGLTVIGEVHESEANYDAIRADVPPLTIEAEA